MILAGLLGDLDTTGAACKGKAIDTSVSPARDAFFPERGTAQITARDAKMVCNGENGSPVCPIREKCLEYALGRKERFGIWGGKSERERAKIAKQRRVEKRRQELEVELMKKRRSDAAKLAWQKRRTAALELEQAAVAATRIKENSGQTGKRVRRVTRAA